MKTRCDPRSAIFDPRRAQAFTLIVMLMVVAIIALIAAVGIPAFVKTIQKTPITRLSVI